MNTYAKGTPGIDVCKQMADTNTTNNKQGPAAMIKIQKIVTRRDVEKVHQSLDMSAAESARIAQRQHVRRVLSRQPSIGVLCRNGAPVYYAFCPDYFESADVDAVERAVVSTFAF